MKKLSTCARVATVCGLVAALLGCGGGSSSSAPVVPNSVTIGQLGGTYGAVGQSVIVNWSNALDVACTGSGALTGALSASGSRAVTLTTEGTTTFTVTCGNASQSTTIQTLPRYTNITDPVFEQALVTMGVDDVVDGKVLTANALKVTKMAILGGAGYATAPGVQTAATGNAFITNAIGLENFRNLTYLRFEQQKVATFPLASLSELTYLSLWQEPITSIDLSHNAALETLGLSETSLTTVGLSALASLTALEIQQDAAQQGAVYTLPNGTVVNGFASLDVSHNTKLTYILATGNHLASLDLSQNRSMGAVSVPYNHLAVLSLSGDSSIHTLIADHNALTSLDIAGTAIGQLSGGQGLTINGNPGLATATVTNAAQMTTWCTSAGTSCVMDGTTTFVSGS
jgi:hypothetical protein